MGEVARLLRCNFGVLACRRHIRMGLSWHAVWLFWNAVGLFWYAVGLFWGRLHIACRRHQITQARERDTPRGCVARTSIGWSGVNFQASQICMYVYIGCQKKNFGIISDAMWCVLDTTHAFLIADYVYFSYYVMRNWISTYAYTHTTHTHLMLASQHVSLQAEWCRRYSWFLYRRHDS